MAGSGPCSSNLAGAGGNSATPIGVGPRCHPTVDDANPADGQAAAVTGLSPKTSKTPTKGMNDMSTKHTLTRRRWKAATAALGIVTGIATLALPMLTATPAQAICDKEKDPLCGTQPPPPPSYASPFVHIDSARQTPALNQVRIIGWTADNDFPTTPLTVSFEVDGNIVSTGIANLIRPDLLTGYGVAHGFDVTISASNAPHTIGVLAHNIDPTGTGKLPGTNTLVTTPEDMVDHFDPTGIDYDLADATITSSELLVVDRQTVNNDSNTSETPEVQLAGKTTEKDGWKDDQTVKIGAEEDASATLSVSVPSIASATASTGLKLTQEADIAFEENGETDTEQDWTWNNPVAVPACTSMAATGSVTQTSLSVPYRMEGSWVWQSGYSEVAATGTGPQGTYSGIGGYDFQADFKQSPLPLSSACAIHPLNKPTIGSTAPKVGVKLTATPGTWSQNGVSVAYQWLRNGVDISGATAAKYTPVAADSGKMLSVMVTASKANYTDAVAISSSYKVGPGTLTAPVPTITGTDTVGKTLTAHPGSWTSGSTLKYQWYAAGKAISGATKATDKLASSVAGKAITVRVTGSKSGYTTVAKTSKATKKIAK